MSPSFLTNSSTMAFLTAAWRKLIMANYVVPPSMLTPYVPWGTELDLWENKCYVSLVGFMFLNTRVMGVAFPFHRDFEEVNLRFYVRRKITSENGAVWRRGAVFIKELVPKPAISWIANGVYQESYSTHIMRHHWNLAPDQHFIQYRWKPIFSRNWYSLSVNTGPDPLSIEAGSEAEFITEHYWGYSKAGKFASNEYEVQHPRWDIYPVNSYEIRGDFAALYGKDFGTVMAKDPASVFLAEGSDIAILGKTRLKPA